MIKGIPFYIIDEELTSELTLLLFKSVQVMAFFKNNKRICIHMKMSENTKNIYCLDFRGRSNSELTNFGFSVKTVKRFSSVAIPMPIYLVIIFKDEKSTDIFEINNLFYLTVKVEIFKPFGSA